MRLFHRLHFKFLKRLNKWKKYFPKPQNKFVILKNIANFVANKKRKHMAKITIYEAREIEMDEPKFYLPGPDIGWAVGIYPEGYVRVTSRSRPFQTEEAKYYVMGAITNSREISEAEFFEIISTNLAFRRNDDEKMKQEWGLEIHELQEPEHDPRQQFLDERGAELNADARRERDESAKGGIDRVYF